MAYTSFTNSIELELKIPSVLEIEAFLPHHFFALILVVFISGLICGLLVIIFHKMRLGDGFVGLWLGDGRVPVLTAEELR